MLGRRGPTGRYSVSGERAGAEGGIAGALALLIQAIVAHNVDEPELQSAISQAMVVLVPAGGAWLMSVLRDRLMR